MKKQLQLRSFDLRPDQNGMQEDLVTVNNYLRQAEIMQAFAVSRPGDTSAVIMFLEKLNHKQALTENEIEPADEKFAERKTFTIAQVKLMERLKAWRSAKASELQLPVFMILPNMAIENIAVDVPETLTQLTASKGMGPIRAQKYGSEILALVQPVEA